MAAAPQMFPVPSQRGESHYLATEELHNTDLAAALAAVGIAFDVRRPGSVVQGDGIAAGGRFTFYFEPKSLDGKYSTAELMAAWGNEAWLEKNPEHPFAYIQCALRNRHRLLDRIKGNVPIGLTRHKGKIALVSLNASQRTQDLVFKQL